VVGGGFAGAYVARLLGKRGATIVNPDNFMLYTPLLPEAAEERSSLGTSSSRSGRCARTRSCCSARRQPRR
jgi:NADH dehydrogenase FAD-containing subunit